MTSGATYAAVAVALGAGLAAAVFYQRTRRPALEAMPHQVGGHACEQTSMKLYDGRLLKPFQSKNRGEREWAFYVVAQNDAALRPFLPAFDGDVTLSGRRYIQLENLLHGMTRPCVMDIKMGTKSYEPNASAAKVEEESRKFPLQATVGFRLQAIKVYDDVASEYTSYDKYHCRTFQTLDEVRAGLATFFASPEIRAAVVPQILGKLAALQTYFDSNARYHFIASSLLFVYDAAAPGTRCDVRLIDFAHVQMDVTTRDDGLCTGLRSLTSLFQSLQA
ncbi:hypothetical protein SPRG_07163 [Saprolegnia parasitica CBS 223.65]|uniref:Kinase n=1 Tax=Saprolegnia parasitica (strain CBS 223.65) TaxID=695850 RepID=A0A067CMX6_SAPPC|nr:hypothetical protein SPRG_07163 [Saprolegnia parasitica CBS 223.65]KDO27891.1 hypothetical protein SPRG_07163 [Saprolegnia parasitica CBS 223.65]|eukprot:XP_012201348.1 hypothetical protein SPRG_07163 [Saprolegnia parasitica CBS 223.65]